MSDLFFISNEHTQFKGGRSEVSANTLPSRNVGDDKMVRQMERHSSNWVYTFPLKISVNAWLLLYQGPVSQKYFKCSLKLNL